MLDGLYSPLAPPGIELECQNIIWTVPMETNLTYIITIIQVNNYFIQRYICILKKYRAHVFLNSNNQPNHIKA